MNGTVGKNADVQWITVSFQLPPGSFRRKLRDAILAKRLRNKTVERWTDTRILLGPVQSKVACHLVDFVFHGVGRHHFHKALQLRWRTAAWGNTVPRMRFVEDAQQFPKGMISVFHT